MVFLSPFDGLGGATTITHALLKRDTSKCVPKIEHPFLRDNELSVHGGYAAGFGDTFAGPKAAIDYGYKLAGSLWLDIAGGFLCGVCQHAGGPARRWARRCAPPWR